MALKKPMCGGEKYFKIMVKLAQNSIRSTELSIAYSPCYSIVLMCYNLRLSSTPLKSIDYMPFRLVVYAQFYNSKMNFS